ncbi:MAG: HAMP domain-containing sensor histidine kinase [Sphingomonas sp.]|jgi:signal transduction histidine kinase
MASDHKRGLGVIATASGLVVAGAGAVWAWLHGFYGTLFFAALVSVWLIVLLWWESIQPRGPTAIQRAAEDDGERIILRTLLDQAPGALLEIEGGCVHALNRAARMLFATDDLVLPAPPALLTGDTARLRHGGRDLRIDRAAVHGVGARRTLVALIDVEAEEHAAEARATRDLFRVLGHEVMNAMAPITSLAESALAVLEKPEQRDRLLPEILGTLSRRADGLRRFTEAYRQVARLPEPTSSPVPITDLFADLFRLFDAQWQGDATLVIADPGTAAASFDRDQMVQALVALLCNGVEAPRAVTAPRVVWLSATVTPDRLTFHVADDGLGVDPMQRASIFRPFFTTKADGNGIGLTAARQIAQSHGGDLSLRSDLPTMFDLSIPR